MPALQLKQIVCARGTKVRKLFRLALRIRCENLDMEYHDSVLLEYSNRTLLLIIPNHKSCLIFNLPIQLNFKLIKSSGVSIA